LNELNIDRGKAADLQPSTNAPNSDGKSRNRTTLFVKPRSTEIPQLNISTKDVPQIELSIGSALPRQNVDPFGANPNNQRADAVVPLNFDGNIRFVTERLLGQGAPKPCFEIEAPNLFGSPVPIGAKDPKTVSGTLSIGLPQSPRGRNRTTATPDLEAKFGIPLGPKTQLNIAGNYDSQTNTADQSAI
jgi:hypothetical protein